MARPCLMEPAAVQLSPLPWIRPRQSDLLDIGQANDGMAAENDNAISAHQFKLLEISQ